MSNDVPFNSFERTEDGSRIRKGEGVKATIRHNSIWNTLLYCSGGQKNLCKVIETEDSDEQDNMDFVGQDDLF